MADHQTSVPRSRLRLIRLILAHLGQRHNLLPRGISSGGSSTECSPLTNTPDPPYPLYRVRRRGLPKEELFEIGEDRADQGHAQPGNARMMIRHYCLRQKEDVERIG